MEKNNRRNTRNKVWPDTEAHLTFRDKMSDSGTTITRISAKIMNLAASGMFVQTEETVPTMTELDIIIDFKPGSNPPIAIHATGNVVRTDKNGFAVAFTKIDVHKLGECIMKRLNSR